VIWVSEGLSIGSNDMNKSAHKPQAEIIFEAPLARGIKPLEAYKEQSWKCVRCGMCRGVNPEKVQSQRYSDSCPAGTRFKYESYFASGRQEIIRALTAEPPELEITERLLKVIYSCTACGHCQVNCNPIKNNEPLNAFTALREWLVQKGYGPLPGHNVLIKSIQNYDNPWMSPRTGRDKWARALKVKDLNKEKAEVLYYVGCTGAYDPNFQPVAQATAAILSSAGVDFGILGKSERCCGSTMLRVGDRAGFEKNLAPNLEKFNSLGAKVIVTACAGCYSTLKHEYAEHLEAPVLHITEYLAQLLREKRINFRKELSRVLTYHDPCHIGRYCGVYDAPREVLRAIPGLEFRELERRREYSWCCGSGGGVKGAFPDFAVWTAGERLQEVKDIGATGLVTACPFCEQNFADANAFGGHNLELYDLARLVAELL